MLKSSNEDVASWEVREGPFSWAEGRGEEDGKGVVLVEGTIGGSLGVEVFMLTEESVIQRRLSVEI